MKEVAIKKEQALAVPEMWGAEESVRTSDIVLPSLVLMQALSPPVVEGVAKPGDIISFPTRTVIGGATKPVVIQPITELPKTWAVYLQPKRGKIQFVETIPFEGNETLPTEEDTPEGTLVRYESFNFFVMVQGQELPHKVSFKKSSKFVGKQIYTHLVLCRKSQLSPASYLLGLKSKQQVTDDNAYFVYDLLADKKKVELKDTVEAYQWFQSLRKNEYKVVEETTEE